MPCKTSHLDAEKPAAADLHSLLSSDRVAFTPKEFAAFFNRSATWGYRQLYAGKIKRLGGSDSMLIPRSELERFLNQTVRHE